MADSLRDQLLKSGLVQKLKSEAKPAPAAPTHKPAARPTAHPSHKPAGKPTPKTVAASASELDLAQAYALRARQEKADRERAERQAQEQAREKKERKLKLGQLLANKALNAADAEFPRHFPHGNKIRRIYCTVEQLSRLNHGDLAIVQLAGRYLLVEREIALQAQIITPEALVLLPDPNAPADDDVPPDLVW
jgi:uncharacterized protein